MNCNWVAGKASEGAIKIYIYENGDFERQIYKEIEGCNHPFNLLNQDGSYTTIFLGMLSVLNQISSIFNPIGLSNSA